MRRKTPWLVAAALLLAASAAFATTVIQLSLPECVAGAEHAFEGRVLAVQGLRDAKGMICSKVSVQVLQYLKGNGPAVHEFTIPGGSFEGRRALIPGMPEFRVGEESIVMLSDASRMGTRVPVGLGQGKYRIATDARTGRKLAQRELGSEVTLVNPGTGALVHEPASSFRDYDDLIAEIRRIVEAQSKEKKK